MQALTHLVQGLVVTHVTLLVFFLIGSAAFPRCVDDDGAGASRTMLRLCVTIGVGLSIAGLGLFAIGLFGWLTIPGILALLAVLFAAACALRRTSPLQPEFWRLRLRVLTHCWNWPLAVVYALLLLVGTRAVIPDAIGFSDAIYYHLAYAQDWANAGRIVVDPYLVFAFYGNNFLLLFTAWIVLGAGLLLNFLTWSTGLLTGLALYAAIDDYAGERVKAPWRIAVGLLAVFAVVSAPIFLDYAVLGYIDVQIGCMLFLSVVAVQLAVSERRSEWLICAAVIAGFLVGMKGSFIAFIPVFGGLLLWGGIVLKEKRRWILALLALFIAVACPWYVRNTIIAGDPIAPTFNFAIYGHDGLWRKLEWQGLMADIDTPKTPKAFLKLPLRAYLDPTAADFREYGASGLILFLYVPSIAGLALLILRRPVSPVLGCAIAVLTLTIFYYFFSSTLLRYATLFYPLLAFCVSALALEMVRRVPRLALVAVAVAVVAALPAFGDTGNIKGFARNDLLGDFHELLHYPGDLQYLIANDDGFAEEQLAVKWMHEHGYTGNVYVISDNAFDYYFRREGVNSIGNWDGPAGYFRLLHALDSGQAADFLAALNTRAVLFSPQQMIDANLEYLLAKQLKAAGYRELTVDPESNFRVYVRG